MSIYEIAVLSILAVSGLIMVSAIVWIWVEVKRAIASLHASVGGGIKVVVHEAKEEYTLPVVQMKAIYRDQVEDEEAKKEKK